MKQKEQVKVYYEVQVKSGTAQKEIVNAVTLKGNSGDLGEISELSNEVKTTVEEGKLELKIVSVDAIDGIMKSGFQYRYTVYLTNKSNDTMKDLEVKINASEILNIVKLYYITSNDKAVIKNDSDTIQVSEITAGETIEISVYTTVSAFQDNVIHDVSVWAIVNDSKNNNICNSNEVNLIAKSDLVIKLDAKSENNGQYVKSGDTIKYNIVIKNEGNNKTNSITLRNWISNDTTLMKVTRNGQQLSKEDYSLNIDGQKNKKLLELLDSKIEVGESIEYQIEVIVNLLEGNTTSVELTSEFSLVIRGSELATAKLSHILQPDESEGNVPENPDNPDKPNEYKIISGVAWMDENEDGQKGMEEKGLEGISVKLLNVKTNEFVKDSNGNIVTVKTSSTGFYSFDKVERGQYVVVFEYDNTKYGLTTFEKEGVSNEANSNVIVKNININGEEKNVSATEIINVNEDNISNINIGLITAKKYDLQLDKYISKVTVQNNKTLTNTYENATLVKQEIDAKQVASTMVVVEYTIKVTNKGDVSGYVKKIADYLSKDYKFNSELNKSWYQSGDDLYCTSLANEEIKPGESKEVKLTVIKEMTENNTGLVNNTAEIVSSYNEFGLKDINSTEGNKVKGENDMGSADLIISIRTGQAIMAISLVILAIVILGISIFLLRRFIITKD